MRLIVSFAQFLVEGKEIYDGRGSRSIGGNISIIGARKIASHGEARQGLQRRLDRGIEVLS
jgi:hypothetical protein